MGFPVQYRDLTAEELCPALFVGFTRRQVVTKCWRRENGQWVIRDDPFIDDWTPADYETLTACLKNTIATSGLVHAAFLDGVLKGFVSVEPAIFGVEHRYMDLSSIHVSQELRGRGIGAALFSAARDWARSRGAKKLYISAHSAVETQSFYRAMGCVEAEVPCEKHVEAEPFDCQLERLL